MRQFLSQWFHNFSKFWSCYNTISVIVKDCKSFSQLWKKFKNGMLCHKFDFLVFGFVIFLLFFYVGIPSKYIFLTTFYGLYFNHQLHITLNNFLQVLTCFMVTFCGQFSCSASTTVFFWLVGLLFPFMVIFNLTEAVGRGVAIRVGSARREIRKLKYWIRVTQRKLFN